MGGSLLALLSRLTTQRPVQLSCRVSPSGTDCAAAPLLRSSHLTVPVQYGKVSVSHTCIFVNIFAMQ